MINRFIGWLENCLDIGDAVKRRRKANQIYKDLVAERISINRAVSELKELNRRQKGGWLLQGYQAWRNPRRTS